MKPSKREYELTDAVLSQQKEIAALKIEIDNLRIERENLLSSNFSLARELQQLEQILL